MKNQNVTRLANVALRGATLGSKFVLVFILAKFLEPAEVGLYGLLTATVAYALMAIGFDFYTYSTRELINTDRKDWSALLRDQCIFYGMAYALILPVCLALFGLGYLPWTMALWFFPILVLEHVAQEFNRLLIAMSEQLWASVVLFFRSGLWAIVAAACMWMWPSLRNLNFVFGSWVTGGLVACVIAAYQLRSLDWSSLSKSIKWSWIRRGIRVALPFVLSTLSLRALYTVDRYWIESLSGLEVLAAYVLFTGIANVIMTFLDAAIFSFIYPALIAAAGKQDTALFKALMKRLTYQTVAATVGLAMLVIVLAHPLMVWLNRPVYTKHFSLLYWTLLATSLFSISMIPHYGLYAKHKDGPIIASHLSSLPIFAISVYLLNNLLAEAAVPAAMAVAFLFLLVYKTYSLHRCSVETIA